MSFRKETKMRVSKSDTMLIIDRLTKLGMRKLFDDRTVNSVYFDTPLLDMFKDSEEGVLPRKKIRTRWYNDEREICYETKISSIEGRFKTTGRTSNAIQIDELPKMYLFDDDYGFLKSSLKISYSRQYFSLDEARITVDTGIVYENLRSNIGIQHRDPEQVVEIKTGINSRSSEIEKILHLYSSRFSKYSRGLMTFGY